MRGELLPVWTETWRDIWLKLAKHPLGPDDLFSELYREFAISPTPPVTPPPPTEVDAEGRMVRPEDIQADESYKAALACFSLDRARYEEALTSDRYAKPAFRRGLKGFADTEMNSVLALERAFDVLDRFEIDALRNEYFVLVEKFIEKFRPC
ncbi:MAG: hypothetical protein K8F90_10810 [Hyphomicrobiales bacterium]|nr:hypothetical protein [Hyphomicrobiales bacterium]